MVKALRAAQIPNATPPKSTTSATIAVLKSTKYRPAARRESRHQLVISAPGTAKLPVDLETPWPYHGLVAVASTMTPCFSLDIFWLHFGCAFVFFLGGGGCGFLTFFSYGPLQFPLSCRG